MYPHIGFTSEVEQNIARKEASMAGCHLLQDECLDVREARVARERVLVE